LAAGFWGCRNSQHPAAQGAGEGNTATRHPRGGAVLQRREEHPHSLRGCRDPEIQALSPPRVRLVFQGCAWCYRNPPAVHRCALGMAGAPCFKYAEMTGEPGIPRAHLASPCAPAIFTGAPGVIEVHLQSTDAPWEWQVRPVSNKRMPGAPGNLQQVHLGISRYAWRLASPGAPDVYVISQGAPEWQILNHWCSGEELGNALIKRARQSQETQ
jgi:hypothetical protein